MQSARYGLAGFLAMCFAVVGLTGFLAASIAPIPLQRALQREAVLDEAVAMARGADSDGLAALRPRLGDSAAAILGATGAPPVAEIEARVAAERVAQRARRITEAEATGQRLRLMLAVVTLLGGGFGVALLLGGRRVAPEDAVR